MPEVVLKFARLILPFMLAAAFGMSATSAFAADMKAPVKTLLDAVAQNWNDNSDDDQDYFSEDRLNTLYSADFVAAYREASKHPAMDGAEGQTGNPFDYDVITNGQDGCALTDIRIEDDGDGQVTALFKNNTCLEGDADAQKDNTVIFHVVEEKGRAVIDDIYQVENGNSGPGLKQTMHEIATSG